MSERQDTPRLACADDLKNYFKKKDLLGGLTTLELEQLKKNIGIVDGSHLSDLEELTYAELYSKILHNLLVIGVVYKITDFLTIYLVNNTTYSSEIMPLVVIAVTQNQLFPEAFIPDKNWKIKYSPTPTIFSNSDSTKGNITWMLDENGNSAYYDFKNIKFKRDNVLYYTFSELQNGVVIDSSTFGNTKYNIISLECTNNIFLGDTYNNLILPGCSNNTFYKGCINSVIGYNSTDNTFNEAVRYISGTLSNKIFLTNDTTLSTTITKTIHKVNEATIVSFLDPITYSYLVILI